MRGVALLPTPAFLFLAACQPDAETPAPQARPVRAVTVVKRDVGETVSYTGRIEAEDEARLAFRIAGRMIERSVNVGDQVGPGQIAGKLEPHDQLNALRTAQAGVAAAQARVNEAQSNFDRQKTLLARDVASRAQFEQAEAVLSRSAVRRWPKIAPRRSMPARADGRPVRFQFAALARRMLGEALPGLRQRETKQQFELANKQWTFMNAGSCSCSFSRKASLSTIS